MEAKRSVVLEAYGGFDHIGASAALVRIDGLGILFDAGSHTGRNRPIGLPDPVSDKVDLVLISHAHIDHIGSLPLLRERFPDVPIFATEATKQLAGIMLEDAARVMAQQDHKMHFSEDQIHAVVDSIQSVAYNEVRSFRSVKFVFRNAGHILGASTIVVEGNSRIVYTGDFSENETILTPGADFPRTPEPCDILLCETTYGQSGEVEVSRAAEERLFLEFVASTIDGNGRVLVPSFALGRAQEVIAILVAAMSNGTLKPVPIFLDGLARDATDAYISLSSWFSRPDAKSLLQDWRFIKPVQSMADRLELLNSTDPCVIIASSGMLTGGWSTRYARDILGRPDSSIFFVGYLDEESPGYALRDLKSGAIDILDDLVQVKCKYVKSFSLSAHADANGIARMVAAYKPKLLVPMHGESPKRHAVANRAREAVGCNVVFPYNEQRFMINPESGDWDYLLSRSDAAACGFIDRLTGSPTKDEIADGLRRYLGEHPIDHEHLEAFMLDVYTWCAKRVTSDPWATVTERGVFYQACNDVISDAIMGAGEKFRHKIQSSATRFLANLIIHGGNPVLGGLLPRVNVESLDDAQALMVQAGEDIGADVQLEGLYSACKARSEWPEGGESEKKFLAVFSAVETFIDLIRELPYPTARQIHFLSINGCLVGANQGKVAFVVSPPREDTNLELILRQISESRIFQKAGWLIDARNTILGIMELGPKPHEPQVSGSNFGEWLSKAGNLGDITLGVEAELAGIPKLLKDGGFDYRIDNRSTPFIIGTHKQSGKRILVALIGSESELATQVHPPGCVVDEVELRILIKRLDNFWKKKVEPLFEVSEAGFAIEVLTRFGWRAYKLEDERRRALDEALGFLEIERVWKILILLTNLWKNRNPSNSAKANSDRVWLETAYATGRNPAVSAFNWAVLSYCDLDYSQVEFKRVIAVRL